MLYSDADVNRYEPIAKLPCDQSQKPTSNRVSAFKLQFDFENLIPGISDDSGSEEPSLVHDETTTCEMCDDIQQETADHVHPKRKLKVPSFQKSRNRDSFSRSHNSEYRVLDCGRVSVDEGELEYDAPSDAKFTQSRSTTPMHSNPGVKHHRSASSYSLFPRATSVPTAPPNRTTLPTRTCSRPSQSLPQPLDLSKSQSDIKSERPIPDSYMVPPSTMTRTVAIWEEPRPAPIPLASSAKDSRELKSAHETRTQLAPCTSQTSDPVPSVLELGTLLLPPPSQRNHFVSVFDTDSEIEHGNRYSVSQSLFRNLRIRMGRKRWVNEEEEEDQEEEKGNHERSSCVTENSVSVIKLDDTDAVITSPSRKRQQDNSILEGLWFKSKQRIVNVMGLRRRLRHCA